MDLEIVKGNTSICSAGVGYREIRGHLVEWRKRGALRYDTGGEFRAISRHTEPGKTKVTNGAIESAGRALRASGACRNIFNGRAGVCAQGQPRERGRRNGCTAPCKCILPCISLERARCRMVLDSLDHCRERCFLIGLYKQASEGWMMISKGSGVL